jgi:hypothetical protein
VKSLLKHRLAWPVIALAALLLLNQVFRPDFLSLRMQDGHLYGSRPSKLPWLQRRRQCHERRIRSDASFQQIIGVSLRSHVQGGLCCPPCHLILVGSHSTHSGVRPCSDSRQYYAPR